ncbi:hypothetical protein ACWDRR_33245 [Kitasatospora sp. NPDC003701]
MLPSLETTAVLSGLQKVHRDRLFWKPRIQLNLDCFVCERVGRTSTLEQGAERAICWSGRDEHTSQLLGSLRST